MYYWGLREQRRNLVPGIKQSRRCQTCHCRSNPYTRPVMSSDPNPSQYPEGIRPRGKRKGDPCPRDR